MVETMLTEWYESTVTEKLVLDGSNYQNCRTEECRHVCGPFFDVLQKAYKRQQSSTKGIVYIACAKPGQGKTHAAAYLLDHYASKKGHRRGLMIRGGKNRQQAYDLEICQQLGVPVSCRFSFDWIEKLLMALSGEEHEMMKKLSYGESFLDFVTEMFCGASTVETTTPRIQHSPKNEWGHYPPLLILDDWNTASTEQMKFLKELAQEAFRKRVMVVVLADEEKIAWESCQQNGLQRIKPLLGSYENVNLQIGDAINWRSLDWDKKQLTKLVTLDFPDFVFTGVHPSPFDGDGNLTFVEDGMTPTEALDSASYFIASTLPLNSSSTSAP